MLEGLKGILGRPLAIALDTAGGAMYVTDSTSKTVIRANLDGSSPKALGDFGGLIDTPSDIAVDSTHEKLYIASFIGRTGRVIRADLDGSGVENLGDLGGTVAQPLNVAVEPLAGRLYVADNMANTMCIADLEGGNVRSLGNLDGALHEPTHMALDVASGRMYIANWGGDHFITRANLDGTGGERLGEERSELYYQSGVGVYFPF